MGDLMRAVAHLLRRTRLSLWENIYLNLVATGVIATALLLAGVFLSMQNNLSGFVDSWERDVHVSAYFDADVSDTRRFELRESVARDGRVEAVRYVSSSDAATWLTGQLDGMEDVIGDLGPDVLPASLEIQLVASHANPSTIQEFVRSMRGADFVAIDYGLEWVQRFNAFLSMLQLLGAILGLLILLAALFLVSNTLDLIMFTRRDEIEIQKYVGATSSYITTPFILEGALQGAVGAGLSIAALISVNKLLVVRLQKALHLEIAGSIEVLPDSHLIGIMVAGTFVGTVAALVSVRRFLARAE
jgi:cell division transport system permease protein